ncbi:MAG: hypothetical protein KTR23_17360 [Rhodospirillales bacterium]|nr:hypothetical protein [Rhodospirillales bacterium]
MGVSTAKPVLLYPLGHEKQDQVPISKNDPVGHFPTALPVLVALVKPQGSKRVFVRKSTAPQIAYPGSEKFACVCCATTSDVPARIPTANTIGISKARHILQADLKQKQVLMGYPSAKQYLFRDICDERAVKTAKVIA